MLHLLALGDSYTIGEAVPPEQRWVEQWAGLMQAEGHAIARPVRVIAQTGWTTDELAQAIIEAEPIGFWDLVTLLIGVNNQYRGRDLENFRREFNTLLDTASAAAGHRPERVQVLSIPDWGQTPFGAACGRDLNQVGAEIDAFNGVIAGVCGERGIALLDITGLTRRHSADSRMHAEDGLHPSAAMYRLWAEALLCTGKFGRL
jgi:lysophospholipase L1-like esterase